MSLTREHLEMREGAIADTKIIAYLEEEVRGALQLLSMVKEVVGSLDSLSLSRFKEVMDSAKRIKEETERTHRDLLAYISRVSPALYHREDWLRATYNVRNSIDRISGILYRLEFLVSRGWAVPQDVKVSILELCESVIGVTESFRQIINLIPSNPSMALNQCSKLAHSETEADAKFRSSTFVILSSNLSPNTVILLLNIAEMLEDVSDIIYSASEDIYIVLTDMARP